MCSSSSSQKTTIPKPSEQEKALMSMYTDGLMMSYLYESGYDVTKNQQDYQSSQEYKNFQNQRTALEGQRASLEKIIADGGGTGTSGRNGVDTVYSQLASVNSKLQSLSEKENKFIKNYDPQTSYEVRKMGSAEEEAARRQAVEKYGNLSDDELAKLDSNYGGIKAQYEQDKIAIEKQQREMTQTYMDSTMKFLNGDFSIRPDQAALIADRLSGVRTAVEQMFGEAGSGAASGGEGATGLFKNLNETFDAFIKETKQTSMDIGAALDVVGNQIKQTGTDMKGALSSVVGANKELMKMGIEDYTGAITKQVASQAARQGRSPDDPEYQKEIQENVARQVKEGTLNLAAMEAQGMLSIEERTGSGLEGVAQQRVALAERTGSQLEQAALQRGMGEADLMRGKGSAMISLAEQESAMQWQVGAGMVPQQVGLAQGVDAYNQAVIQQRIANAGGAMSAPLNAINYYQGDRRAQPTTTTTTTQSPLGGIMGAAGAAASIYGGVASAGAMNQMAGAYGGGNSPPAGWQVPMIHW